MNCTPLSPHDHDDSLALEDRRWARVLIALKKYVCEVRVIELVDALSAPQLLQSRHEIYL